MESEDIGVDQPWWNYFGNTLSSALDWKTAKSANLRLCRFHRETYNVFPRLADLRKNLGVVVMTPLSPEEVNEKVALKLGWFNISRYTPMAWSGKKQKERLVGSFHTVGADASLVDVPDYSGKIEAAWEIVEKQPRPVVLLRDSDMHDPLRRIWTCEFLDYKASADTAPMAIALCFLKIPS